MRQVDIAVVGGGIVGLATAWHVTRSGVGSVLVLEKEDGVALHQTGRNSGVIHSGIYYAPGSQKALNCRAGRASLIEFCGMFAVEHEICGKVIVAATPRESAYLNVLHERGQKNGVASTFLSKEELREREPAVAGVAALRVDDAGIVDFPGVCRRLADQVVEAGGEIQTGAELISVTRDRNGYVLTTSQGDIGTKMLVNCAGLHADRVARMTGENPGLQIVPFRGHYYELREDARHLCQHLIYPVPNPAYPFLGVHFTRMVGGAVECGPNALLAFAREGYNTWDVDVEDLAEMIAFAGFRRLMRQHWKQGIRELGLAVSRRQYLRALRRLVPDIELEHLLERPAGIRAQAVMPNGTLADDFIVLQRPHAVHVLNAPSPAATAGLEIGRRIAALIPMPN